MKRGKKNLPTHFKVINGNPGGRPLNANEAQPEVELPIPPASLSAAQRAVWDDVVPALFRMHPTLTSGPGARRLLVRYCQAVVVADMAIGELKAVRELTATGAQGQPIKN